LLIPTICSFIVNVIILYFVDKMFGSKFEIKGGVIKVGVVSLLLSCLGFLIDKII
jgi:hypothetical protein